MVRKVFPKIAEQGSSKAPPDQAQEAAGGSQGQEGCEDQAVDHLDTDSEQQERVTNEPPHRDNGSAEPPGGSGANLDEEEPDQNCLDKTVPPALTKGENQTISDSLEETDTVPEGETGRVPVQPGTDPPKGKGS